MPRSIWKGAISFGLVTIPVKVYGATESKSISFRQVHPADGGRIKYKRVCEKCGEEVPFADIAKGYEASDGRVAVLGKEDFDALPLKSTKAVEVVQFVDEDEIDPTYFESTYVLEAEGPGVKPYVLLRDALAKTSKSAVVKVALRSRESLALVRPKDRVLLLHTMLWPDEVRDTEFAAPPEEVQASAAEVGMAEMFITQMEGEFNPDDFTDEYRQALDELVATKLSGVSAEEAEGDRAPAEADVVDLVAALRASVEAAKKRRADEKAAHSADADAGSRGTKAKAS